MDKGFRLKSIYVQLVFLFEPRRNLLIRKGFQLKSIYFQFIWIYFQLIFHLNLKEIYWQERISIEINLLSIRIESTFNWFSF